MSRNDERYKAWSDGVLQAWSDGNVEAWVPALAENCAYTSIQPFGEHETLHGREAVLENITGMFNQIHDRHVSKNELLSADDERGILNAWTTWRTQDGTEQACNFIYIVNLDKNDRCISYQEWNVFGSKNSDGNGEKS